MENRWDLPFAAHPRLELTVPAASVRVEAVLEGESPCIEVEGRAQGAPVPNITLVEGDVVKVDVTGSYGGMAGFPFRPRGLMRIRVPRNVQARIRNQLGRVQVVGLRGCELDLMASAGSISLSDVHGILRLHSSAGAITGRDVGGTLDVRTEAGSVKLLVSELAAGTHRVHSSMGAVKLFLKPGLDVRIDADTNMGSVRTRYPTRADAPAVLTLHADLGSVRVQEASARETFEEDAQDWQDPVPETSPGRKLENAVSWAARFAARWGEGFAPPRPPPYSAQSPVDYAPPPPVPPARVSAEEMRRVLSLVESGKITAQDAEQLLKAMER